MAGAFFHVTVTADTSVLDSLMPRTKPVAAQVLKNSAFRFEAAAKQFAPVDTGALRASIHASALGSLSWEVRDGVEYGVYQEFGVMHPYLINSPVFIKRVGWRYIKNHPGFPPQPFFTPAAEQVGANYFIEFFPAWLNS
jgi:hypothetical protein